MQTLIDYRNARYQGQTTNENIRNGFGILIDDDLSFYASQWQQGRINNSTVIYISHAKYIYGQWLENEPHGLNVFRIGDTVVLGEFDNGFLRKKIVVIFQKVNFVAILEEVQGDWTVCQRGLLKNYNQLVRYIEDARIPMKPQYFSLTKFLTSISNEMASAVPCQGTENCYYGFEEGLGIAFNPSNGVVSVGYHSGKKLTQCGGKFQHPNYVVEGNFQTGELVKYSTQRPKQQLYSIYQKLHKRSLNFKNQYFDSKVKLLSHIEQLIRSKIDQIMNQNAKENTFTALDLNDSLDYHAENLEEINKVNRIREDVYENVHIPMKKTVSQYTEPEVKASGKKSVCVTPTKKKMEPIINAPASPILMKKSPIKNKQKERQKQMMRTPSKKSYINKKDSVQYREETFAIADDQPPFRNVQRELERTPSKKTIQIKPEPKQNRRQIYAQQIPLMRYPYSHTESSTNKSQVSSSSIKRPICQNSKSPYHPRPTEQYNELQASPVDQILVSSKDYHREKEIYNVPSFKYSCSEFDKNQSYAKTVTRNAAEVKISGSERLERVERVDRVDRVGKIQNVEWVQSSSQSRSSVSPMNTSKKYSDGRPVQLTETSKSPIKGPNYQNLSQRRKRLLKQFKNLNTQNENAVSSLLSKIVPSSMNRTSSITSTNQPQISVTPSVSVQEPVRKQFYDIESPCAREKFPRYESKATEQQSQTFLPLTICNANEPVPITQSSNWRKDQAMNIQKQNKFSRQLSQKQSYLPAEPMLKSAQRLSYKENIDSSPMLGGRPFQKKQSFYQRAPQPQPQQQPHPQPQKTDPQLHTLTPTRRKTYQYYFDE